MLNFGGSFHWNTSYSVNSLDLILLLSWRWYLQYRANHRLWFHLSLFQLKDLAFFIVILFVVIMGYGVASRSMVYHSADPSFDSEPFDTSFSGRPIFRQIIYPVYYLLYGDVGSERGGLDCKYSINKRLKTRNYTTWTRSDSFSSKTSACKLFFLIVANRDQSWSIATHVLLALHLLFVNILLINLLIAIFR